MLVIDWKDLPTFDKQLFSKGVAISIGGFDGIHIGHKALLNRLICRAKERGKATGIVTFYSPPRFVLGSVAFGCVSSVRLKIAELEKIGFDFIVLIDFSVNFAKISGHEFVALLKEYLNVEYVLVGEDFRFGCDRKFSIKDMDSFARKFSFCFEVFENVSFFEATEKVSSSIVRRAIYEGKLAYASRLLGQEVTIDLLGLLPCECSLREVVFRKENILQVLPRSGEYAGSVFFVNSKVSQRVRVLFFENFFKIEFNGFEVDREELHFDLLKLQAI